MPRRTSPDERLFPAKLTAAVVSLMFLVGLFVVTLNRGYVDFYPYLLAAVTLAVAAGIVGRLVRRRRRHRLGLDDR